ncbi:MAG TPA: ABC transporter permease [Bryobacteraceae bacterium]|nr:ABC transporter permease [Bryobacteraceae bacterium]
MRWLLQLKLRLRSLAHRSRLEQEINEEFQFHLDQRIDQEIAAGRSAEEAKAIAIRSMDGLTQRKEECREALRMNLTEDLVRDFRYTIRNLQKDPRFAALAVFIMALGIGANTAVFSAVNAVLLKPLPYIDPDRIVALTGTDAGRGGLLRQVSRHDVDDWRAQSRSFDGIAYYVGFETSVMAGEAAEYVQAAAVSTDFFGVFGVEPVLGRFGTESELMISHSYWQSHFAADRSVLGKVIRMLGRNFTITGVLAPGFEFPDKSQIWLPLGQRTGETRSSMNYVAVGRLKPNVSLEQAQAEMTAITQGLEREYPDSNKGRGVSVTRLQDDMVGDVRWTLYLIWAGVGLVLLIACANTATLQLGKATARTREVAVRAALGASRTRIARQLITESAALALLAGAAGLAFAYWGIEVLRMIAPADLPRLAEAEIDMQVLAFTLSISLVTSLLFGILPALHARTVDPNRSLRQGGTRSVIGGGVAGIRGALVVAEISLATMLLAGAGLLIKSYSALQNVPLGYHPENVLVIKTTVPLTPDGTPARFFQDLLPQIAAIPGVSAAGATMAPPGNLSSGSYGAYFVDHMGKDRMNYAHKNVIAPGTFAALGVPLTRGRDFSETDVEGRQPVAIVNEALVRLSFGGEDPVGRTIYCPFDNSDPMTIVGVVGDVRQRGPDSQAQPECYLNYRQHEFNGNTLHILVRTSADPRALSRTVQGLALELSPEVPMKFTSMKATVAGNVAAPRFRTLLFGLFAGLSVCLAVAGVYGVMAFAVGQRSNEIGLRMALGASEGAVLQMILRHGLLLVAIGLAIGLGAALAASRLMRAMLFEVKPNDPLVYLSVAIVLAIVTLIGSYIPARRAAHIDPLTAIRQD